MIVTYFQNMKIIDIIRSKVDRMPSGYVFTCSDFTDEVKSWEGLVKALNRLAASGKIEKLAKGKYFKPEQSPFGTLEPGPFEIVKDLLERDGKIDGYLTGASIFNSFGFTTQVSSLIQIGKNKIRSPMQRGKYRISFVKQDNTITKENVPILQLLDIVRFIKKIPDSEIENNCKILLKLLSSLSEKEVGTMIRLVLKYPPSTRALVGAFLTKLGGIGGLEKIKRSLNPISSYKVPGVTGVLSSAVEWKIK
jgi:hypothetical protein